MYFKKALICTLLLCFLLLSSGCSTNHSYASFDAPTLKTTMYCSYILLNQSIYRQFEAHFSAIIMDKDASRDTISLFIALPSDWRYSFEDNAISYGLTHDIGAQSYLQANGYLYDTLSGNTTPHVLALDLEAGYFILKLDARTQNCLVGSTQPDVDPFAILEHFTGFIEPTESYSEEELLDILEKTSTETDLDGDGLSDFIEIYLGSNRYHRDTDDDGVSDYDEFCVTGTNVLYPDGDLDSDGDGLSNALEGIYGTSPGDHDTDNDNLNDYDEIMVHHTDPLEKNNLEDYP